MVGNLAVCNRSHYRCGMDSHMTSPSETQLTLRERLRELKIPYKGRYVPVDRLGSYMRLDDEQIDHIAALFTQALTSVKNEMEALKTFEVRGSTQSADKPNYLTKKSKYRNEAISECQRVMDGLVHGTQTEECTPQERVMIKLTGEDMKPKNDGASVGV